MANAATSPAESTPGQSLQERLKPFLETNPKAILKETPGHFVISKPWNDHTLRLKGSKQNDKLIESLNRVALPARFTAIWHREFRNLEVIWGVVPKSRPEYSRKFHFNFEGHEYLCQFGSASEELNSIVQCSFAVEAESHTNFRNLVLIKDVLGRMNQVPPDPVLADYAFTSFWIYGIELQESTLVRFIRHLNFYMRYFDRETPCIIIHEENPPDHKTETPVQFVNGTFPAEMSSRRLDSELLMLWENTVTAPDPFRRYLYNYQILEYAAFYSLDEKLKQRLKKIICSPESLIAPEIAAAKAQEAFADSRMTDEQKFDALIHQHVSPEVIWKQIEPNLDTFCKDTVFEGGFVLGAILKPSSTLADFHQIWPTFPNTFRKIRNSLVHCRENRSSKYIAPTGANYGLLRPWIPLISSAAMEAILYAHI